MPVRMCRPIITDQDIDAVVRVLRSGVLALGPVTEEFERCMAQYIGTEHAIGVSSGTAGLHLCAVAAGVEPGDEVITTSFSFIASSNCILYQGAVPKFVDIDSDTCNIDPHCVEAAITPRTRAIVTVDVFGQPADADALRDIADRHRLVIIEDACEALGAEYKGRKVGSLGDFATFGFYPNKQMTAGEGGMVMTNRKDAAERIRSLRNQGRDSNETKQTHVDLGYNYRLDEMSAALGLSQFRRLEALLQQRENVARLYHDRIREIEGVETLKLAPTTTRLSWFAYIVRLPPGANRDIVARELSELGIPTRAYFDPIHLQPLYRERFGYGPGLLPVTESLAQRTLGLPFHGEMTAQDIDIVCQALRAVLAKRMRRQA